MNTAPDTPGGLPIWWLGTGGGMDGALMWGGNKTAGPVRTGFNGIPGGGRGRGGREVSLADWSLPSNMLVLLFTGWGGPTGSTGIGDKRRAETKKTGNGSSALTWSKAVLFILDRTRTPWRQVTCTIHRCVPLRRLRVGWVGRRSLSSCCFHGTHRSTQHSRCSSCS